jgi:hypothetical protein
LLDNNVVIAYSVVFVVVVVVFVVVCLSLLLLLMVMIMITLLLLSFDLVYRPYKINIEDAEENTCS